MTDAPLHGVSVGVIKIAIDKRSRESENKGHEESFAGVLPASDRLRGEEAAGCGDPSSDTEPVATTRCRTHRTLRSNQAGKCQHGDLQLSARDHSHRFKNGAHQAGLQENERGEMRRQKPGGHAERIVDKPEIIPVVGAKTAITVTILSTGWGVSRAPM